MLFLVYRHTDDGVFYDFRKFSDHFPRIFEDSFKFVRRSHDLYRAFSENVRRLPKTFKGDPKMFRSYTNEFKYNLRDKLDICEIINICTNEDMACGFV